jgi:predicted transcriptional regulator
MDAIPGLGRRERQIMDVLHRRGEATVAEVLQDLPNPPTYSGVRAMLRLMQEKGHVSYRQEGARYVYFPAAEREQAKSEALKHVVATFFGGSAEEAVAALIRISDREITEEDIQRLARKVREAEEQGR